MVNSKLCALRDPGFKIRDREFISEKIRARDSRRRKFRHDGTKNIK